LIEDSDGERIAELIKRMKGEVVEGVIFPF
jgi:hypothetical protein